MDVEKLRNIPPYVQSTSMCKHIIWVELNHRVTYPVKRIIKMMDDCQSINMDCPITKFCVSTVLCQICEVGMLRMVNAWNSHPIPHRGIPNDLQLGAFHTSPLQPAEIPFPSDAVAQYRNQGGHLRDPTAFGIDPLNHDPGLLRERERRWGQKCGMDVDQMFSAIISGSDSVLENAVMDFIQITSDLIP